MQLQDHARCIEPKKPTSQMADRILKFMISHLGLGSNVQLDLVDYKISETSFNWPRGF